MAKGRKNGCPISLKDYLIEVSEDATTWVRVYGLESMTYSIDADTEDGSTATDTWEEPYVTKRSASLSLEGKPVCDQATGAEDAGQAILNEYALLAGCDGDLYVRITDGTGHQKVAVYIVTGVENGAEETEETISWDLEQVGEAEFPAYVQVTGVTLKNGGTAISTDSVSVGAAAKVIAVEMTPSGASNPRFRVRSSNRKVAYVSDVTASGFTLNYGIAGTATITVTSVNNAQTATIAVTVSE